MYRVLFILLYSLSSCLACQDKKDNSNEMMLPTILEQLTDNYEQLPEQDISISTDSSVYAQYTNPTERYAHGIMGDQVEAGQLVVVVDSVFYEYTLADNFVFEDLRPRLYDVDGDGELEIITIRSSTSEGAGIAIYKIQNEALVEWANVPEIGTPFRWLNIVAINDLDDDGIVELVWIQTPHIGGILKVAKFTPGEIEILDERSELYSNHASGSRNLCLSVVEKNENGKSFYVPTQDRNKIIEFALVNDKLEILREIELEVDFSQSLMDQYSFPDMIMEEDHCIHP